MSLEAHGLKTCLLGRFKGRTRRELLVGKLGEDSKASPCPLTLKALDSHLPFTNLSCIEMKYIWDTRVKQNSASRNDYFQPRGPLQSNLRLKCNFSRLTASLAGNGSWHPQFWPPAPGSWLDDQISSICFIFFISVTKHPVHICNILSFHWIAGPRTWM